jgi:DNA-binding beta-propeller fold protein YncE
MTRLAALAMLAFLQAAAPTLHVTASVGVAKHPAGLAFDAGKIWVASDVSNAVSSVDPASNAVTRQIALRGSDFPDPQWTTAAAGTLWVVAATTGTISRLDETNGKLTRAVRIPGRAEGIVSASGSLWVPSFDTSRLYRLDPTSLKVLSSYPIHWPTGIDVGYGSLWIVNHRLATVSRVDPATGQIVARVHVRIGHESIFAGPERVLAADGAVWVSHPGQDTITRIDPRRNAIAARIHLPKGSQPYLLAAGNETIWVSGSAKVFEVDPRANRVVASITVGRHKGPDARGLNGLLVDDGSVWVSDADADVVDRIGIGK